MPITFDDPAPAASTSPLFSDDFSSDTRSNYTYLRGAASDLAVSGGQLTMATTTRKQMYPTSLAARKSGVQLIKFKQGQANNGPFLAPRLIDANNCFLIGPYGGALAIYTSIGGTTAQRISDSNPLSNGSFGWLLAYVLGNTVAAMIFDSDPTVGSIPDPIASCTWDAQGTALDANTSGYMGLDLENTVDNSMIVDDYKVWSAGAHPFDF